MAASRVISAVDIEEKVDGKPARVSTVEVIIKPKQGSMPHRHPGAVYGYVLEGTYEFKVEGQSLKTLKAGDTFYEPRMILHEISRNPSDHSITRLIAVIIHPRDTEQLMIPEGILKSRE